MARELSDTATEPQTHVFSKTCGCISSLVLNVPQMFGELAKAQRYAKKHNEVYSLMDTKAVRKMSWTCERHTRHRTAKLI